MVIHRLLYTISRKFLKGLFRVRGSYRSLVTTLMKTSASLRNNWNAYLVIHIQYAWNSFTNSSQYSGRAMIWGVHTGVTNVCHLYKIF